MEVPAVRVLVVDDFEPFRRFVRSTLGERPDLQVIGEASDGLEAVRKAEDLKPDMMVLDIGLPALNGIEVARRIRKLLPECKILFLSQESSVDMAQGAFSLGAMGYVVKAHAGSELLDAVKAVCQGKLFSVRDYRVRPTGVSAAYASRAPRTARYFQRMCRGRLHTVTKYSSMQMNRLFYSALLVSPKRL